MEVPQDGLLQLDQDPDAPVPVDLIAFSTNGVTVSLTAAVPLKPEVAGQLLTQAHGAGLSHRPVRCCWHRPHPQDSDRQLAGLRFAVHEPPERPRDRLYAQAGATGHLADLDGLSHKQGEHPIGA
ncbi:MAG: hypothetical protein ACKO45_00120 [Cyanobium sp.]